jgi:hypothetical protein
VEEGWQAGGLGLKPILGYKGLCLPKSFKTRKARELRRKNWACRLKPKTIIPGCGSKLGSGRVVTSPSNQCLAAPSSTPEVVLVPETTRSVRSDDDDGSLSRPVDVPETSSAQVIGSPNDRHAGTSPVTTGLLPVCLEEDGGSLSRPVGVPEAPSAQVIGLSEAGDLPSFLPVLSSLLLRLWA